jgi:hypothetical protein
MSIQHTENNKWANIVDSKVYVYVDIPGSLDSSIDSSVDSSLDSSVDIEYTDIQEVLDSSLYSSLHSSVDIEFSNNKIKPYEQQILKKEILYGNFFKCVTIPINEPKSDAILTITIKKKRNVFKLGLDAINKFYIKNILR